MEASLQLPETSVGAIVKICGNDYGTLPLPSTTTQRQRPHPWTWRRPVVTRITTVLLLLLLLAMGLIFASILSTSDDSRFHVPSSLATADLLVDPLQSPPSSKSSPNGVVLPHWDELQWKFLPTTQSVPLHQHYIAHLQVCDTGQPGQSYAYRPWDPSDGDSSPCYPHGPSPLIRMTPGSDRTYHLVLHHSVRGDDQDRPPTNLHTHGLHISGVGRVDDVTRRLPATTEGCLVYDYHLPNDADVGTFWYHSHFHPLTAHQVTEGAYGMLLVDEPLSSYYPPHLQQFLSRSNQVVLQYASFVDKTQKPFVRNNYLNGIQQQSPDDRLKLRLSPRQYYYFRISFVILSDPINHLEFVPHGACDVRVVAYDGVYRSTIPSDQARSRHMMTTSSRLDLAVRCQQAAKLYFFQERFNATDPTQYLVDIDIIVEEEDQDTLLHIPASPYWDPVHKTPWNPRRPYYMPDLRQSGIPDDYWNITMDDTTNKITMTAHSDRKKQSKKKAVEINHHHWQQDTPIRSMPLNSLVEWTLFNTEPHPFHIHINRMLIVEPGGCGHRYEEGEYYDSIAAAPTGSDKKSNSTCRVRMQLWDYAGRIVAHCHKLKHEDRGMMVWLNVTNGPGANVQAAPPDDCDNVEARILELAAKSAGSG